MTGSIHTLSSARGRAMAHVGLACAALGLALATSVSAQMPEMVQKVETGHVRLVDLVDALEFTGSVDAWKEVEISSMARAKIVSIPVEEGDRVTKGDLLFEQDSRAEKIALNRAEAELEKARAELHKMNAGFLPEEIEEARKGVAAAESRLNAAREDWRRIEPLVEFGIIPATEATRSKSAFEVAQSELARAESRLDLLKQGFRSEEVQIAQAELKVRQAAVDDIKRRLEDHTVRATEPGVIIKHIKEVGEWTNEGDPVLAFVVLDPMKLRIEAPQIHIGSIHSGQRARMRVDGLDGKVFTAEVINIIPQASVGTRNFPVLLRVDNKDGELHAGMFARVSLQVGKKRKGLAVPRSAIQYRGRRLVVYAVMDLPEGFRYEPPSAPEDSRKGRGGGRGGPGGRERKMIEPNAMVQEIEVEITDERENDVIVTPAIGSRLEPGAEVVVLGGSRLEDGMLVRRLNPLIPGAG